MGADAFNREVDVVKDIKNKQWIKQEEHNSIQNVSEEQLDNFDFKTFDKKIEESFQKFLTSENLKRGKNAPDIKTQFNNWLDNNLKELDTLEQKEIAKEVVWPISFELNTEATLVWLTYMEQQLNNNPPSLDNLKMFSGIDVNHVKNLFTLKFKNRDTLLWFLSSAKNTTKDENVIKFQRMIAELDPEGSQDSSDKAREALWNNKVDWNFWINTVKAFEKYIANHLIAWRVSSLAENTTELDDNDSNDVKQLVEQNAGQETLNLTKIQTITLQVAQELANFKWTIDLSWLKSVNSAILTAFISGKNKVKFPHWRLENSNGISTVKIDGEETAYTNFINNINNICTKLVNGTANPESSNGGSWSGGSWNGSQESNGNNSSASTNNLNNQYTQALDEWFNYAKSVDESELSDQLPKNEKDAIKLLTVWTKAYWLARVFRAKWYNRASSLVDKDYDPMRNKPERIRLKALRAWLESCLKDWNLDTNVLTDALLKWGKGNLKDLNTLYKDFKDGKFDSFPYLERVMELIDDCFIQWWMVDSKWNTIDTFEELYKDILIGSNDDILYNKEKNIDKSLLNEIKAQLNDLETDILGDENDLDDKLTDEYKWMVLAMANIQKLLTTEASWFEAIMKKFSFKENDVDKSVFDNIYQVKFACCLCDLNTDWRIDVADKNTKTWQELFNLIVDAQIEKQDAMKNILDYALNYAENCGHANMLTKLQTINNFTDTNQKIDYIAKHPIVMQYLREMLTKASIDNVRAIVLKWSVEKIELTEEEKKFWEYMMDPKVAETVDKKFGDALAQIKKDLDANKELSEDQKKEILKNLEENPETLKRTLKTAFSWYLALWHQTWTIWVWASILNFWEAFNSALLSNFSIWAHWWLNGNGAMFGLWLAGGNARKINDRWQFTLWWAAGGGYAFWGEGRSLSAAILPGFLYQINTKNLTNTLDVRSAKYIWANAIVMYGTAGFGFGGAVQYKRDMLEGIEQTSANMSMKLLDSLINAYNNWKDSFLDKSKFTNIVFEQLKKDFPNTDDETLKSSTLLLYTWISYYLQKNNSDKDKSPSAGEMGKIFDNVSKDFTLNWKNTAIASLNGDVDLTWVSAWLVWVDGGFAPAWWIQITNYENLFAHDTQESKARYESSLYSELWMELRGNLDDNGYITTKTADYLNKKLSIFFPRWDVPDIDLVTIDWSKKVLSIPKTLCNYIDISYSSVLKDYIKQSDDNHFQVPANMRIWLSTYIWWWTMRATLILWDNKKSSSNQALTIDSKFNDNNNPTSYSPDNEKISLDDVNRINAWIIKFRENNKDFPLQNCERANGEQILFNVLDWASVTVDNTLLKQDWKILLPGNPSGELKVVQKTNGDYIVSFGTNNTKKLSIKYEKHSDFKWEFDFHNDDLDKLFKDIEKELSTFDDKQHTLYSDFMENAMWEKYGTAFDKLKTLLKDANNKSSLQNFATYLNDTSITEYDKMQVVDRFKAIFSYNKGLDTYKWVNGILTRRKDTYKTLNSRYTDTPFPLGTSSKDYRKAVLDELNKEGTIQRTQHQNLIGMTAFYRTDNQKGKWYMLTQLWGTKVLWDVTIPIEQTYLEQTQNWLIDSLEKNDMHEKVLFEKIADTLKVDKDKIKDYDKNKIHKILSDALRWNPIDIWWKIATIKANYVFYLLWECANESIWVEIDGVDEDSYADTVTIDYDVSGSSAWLYVRTQASESQMWISANQHNITIFDVFGGGPIPEEEPTPNAWSNPNWGLPGSWSNPDWGIYLGQWLSSTPPRSRRESLNS